MRITLKVSTIPTSQTDVLLIGIFMNPSMFGGGGSTLHFTAFQMQSIASSDTAVNPRARPPSGRSVVGPIPVLTLAIDCCVDIDGLAGDVGEVQTGKCSRFARR